MGEGSEVDDVVGRFDGRADDYSRFRPRYPRQIIATLGDEIGFDSTKAVADIGSGTGILSELFLSNGNTVFCVEPNGDMRRRAVSDLTKYSPRFVSVDGRAEATNLKDGSVDLLTAGQALHWFSPEESKKEFARILRRGSHIAVVYNHRREDGDVEVAYSELVGRYRSKPTFVTDADDASIAKYMKEGELRKFTFLNAQTLDLEGVMGRMASTSYMPRPGSPAWKLVLEDAQKMLGKFGDRGTVMLHYNTSLYLGQIAPT